jgi:transglutaminase-like putative cysteine protease
VPDRGPRLLAAGLPVGAVALAWASLERPAAPLLFAAVAALALVAALPERMPRRLLVAGGMLLVLTLAAAGRTVYAIQDVVHRGLVDVYTAIPPFPAHAHPELHALVLLTAFAFCGGVAATAGSRPFVGAALTAGGIGWPATVVTERNTIAMGALGLLAVLWPFLVTSAPRRALGPGIVIVGGVVAAAAVIVATGARPSGAALAWQSWDLLGQSRAAKTVQLVWSSDYSGIEFPSTPTTVLKVTAPRRALYWRATTLDLFASDRWIEALYTTAVSGGERRLPRDELLPAAARRPAGWVKQEVDVRAVVDNHIVGAAQPMRIDAGRGRHLQYQSSGVMRAPAGLSGMLRYTIWSYAPQPTPAALARSPARYPRSVYRYLDIGRTMAPAYGYPRRGALVEALFQDERYQPMWEYRPVWRDARRLTAGTTSPYAATVAIERWLRSDGGFAYDERPPAPVRLPPLVDFLERSKLGYCQQFAGSMALMLRYVGIPARVAVGFTSGTWKNGVWTVSDRDAHAWVEAWFAGYGWLTFDPTPGRGRLAGTYTYASDSADAIRALGTVGSRGAETRVRGTASKTAPLPPHRATSARPWPYLLPVGAGLFALLALAAAKSVRRRLRASTTDPRRRASAARADLADFIRDQGSAVDASVPVHDLVAELRRIGISSDAFAAAFARARYGPPGGAVAAAEETWLEQRKVLSLLRGRLGPGSRIRGFLAVRSLRGS